MPDQPTAVAMRLANVADKVLSPLAVADPHHVVMRVARALDDAGVKEAVRLLGIMSDPELAIPHDEATVRSWAGRVLSALTGTHANAKEQEPAV